MKTGNRIRVNNSAIAVNIRKCIFHELHGDTMFHDRILDRL